MPIWMLFIELVGEATKELILKIIFDLPFSLSLGNGQMAFTQHVFHLDCFPAIYILQEWIA